MIEFLVVTNNQTDTDSLNCGLQDTMDNVNKSSIIWDIPVTTLILNGSVTAIPGIKAVIYLNLYTPMLTEIYCESVKDDRINKNRLCFYIVVK